jgi:pyrimidine operon attenuation protein/uracil phosphoribosyltransferase
MQTLMDAAKIRQTLADLASRVLADPAVVAAGPDKLALVGIRNRGEIIAARLADEITARCGTRPPVGALDITMYRDDLTGRRAIIIPRGTDMNFRLDDRVVVLCDDVLGTGRSVRAALDALVDFGRPRLIRMLTLIDRGHREYPIAADFIGLTIANVDPREKVLVHVTPTDSEDAVLLTRSDA